MAVARAQAVVNGVTINLAYNATSKKMERIRIRTDKVILPQGRILQCDVDCVG